MPKKTSQRKSHEPSHAAHCPTAPLPHCPTAPLPHCPTAPLPHCPTASFRTPPSEFRISHAPFTHPRISGGDGSSIDQAVHVDATGLNMALMLMQLHLEQAFGVKGRNWHPVTEQWVDSANHPPRTLRVIELELTDAPQRRCCFRLRCESTAPSPETIPHAQAPATASKHPTPNTISLVKGEATSPSIIPAATASTSTSTSTPRESVGRISPYPFEPRSAQGLVRRLLPSGGWLLPHHPTNRHRRTQALHCERSEGTSGPVSGNRWRRRRRPAQGPGQLLRPAPQSTVESRAAYASCYAPGTFTLAEELLPQQEIGCISDGKIALGCKPGMAGSPAFADSGHVSGMLLPPSVSSNSKAADDLPQCRLLPASEFPALPPTTARWNQDRAWHGKFSKTDLAVLTNQAQALVIAFD